jgi:hypothetical protein
MRMADPRVWLPALAMFALACAPYHRPPGSPPHGPGMAMACGHTGCMYKSQCFSDGAIRSNDGVCQACSGGKWTAATGCRESTCGEHTAKTGKSAPPKGKPQHQEPPH